MLTQDTLSQVHNPDGEKRVIVTKELPGQRWLELLTGSGCRVEISQHEDTILSNAIIKKLIGDKCHGVLGQLTEVSFAPSCLKWTVAVAVIACLAADSQH